MNCKSGIGIGTGLLLLFVILLFWLFALLAAAINCPKTLHKLKRLTIFGSAKVITLTSQ